ncbi:hypothetical protein GALMADRAFT_66539 [Galerina marginata CBS 339.88]|uniref:Uncharacterized protein n=1 Tax=Galerina marginata (strain CBS 339.88) TaxID=685588 RepID=A0A067T3T6_GALM3|nr:hypothetical protein GALMADRAFT_66539 [Galerina marginata CBS 339.88]
MAPIKIGFIGLSSTGWAATVIGPALTQPSMKEHFDIVAITTSSDASSKVATEKYSQEAGHPIKAYYGNTGSAAMTSDPDVELVAISVKASDHKKAVMQAIDAGKDFFVEWPVGSGIHETQEIADAARKKGVRSMVGLQARYSQVFTKAREIIESGKIGAVRSSNMILMLPRELQIWAPIGKEKTAYYRKANGVTLLRTPGGHFLDLFTSVLGGFKTISATSATIYPTVTVVDDDGKPTGKTVPSEVPDHISINGILESGALVNVFIRSGYSSKPGRRQFLWEIEGEEGTIRMEAKGTVDYSDADLYLNGDKVEMEGPTGAVHSVAAIWRAFAQGDTTHYPSIDDAVKNHQLLLAVERSFEERVPVDL